MGIIKYLKSQSSKLKAFTFIEVVVVIGIIAFALPALFSIIFMVLQQQTKIIRLSEVKKQGDYSLNIMENIIRNYASTANSTEPPTVSNQVCYNTTNNSYSGSSLYFLDKSNQWFGFIFSNNKISSASSNLNQVPDLTSNKVIVSNFTIGCTTSADYATPVVNVSFDICYNTGAGTCISSRPEETANLHYQTNIKLRNY